MSLRIAHAARAARAIVAPRVVASRALHASSSTAKDPFPLPFDPALAAAAAEARAARNPEDVIEDWAMPPPLDRTGESPDVLRARLVYQTRKRGTLENDLLFSTFARDNLPTMTVKEMQEFDKLLDEPDWDVYYWCTEKKPAPSKWAETELLAKLKKHVKNEGKEHRFMPDLLDVQKK